MRRKLATGTCLVIVALGLGGCDKKLCGERFNDPVFSLFVGLICFGVPPENTAPTARFTVAPTTIGTGDIVELDASLSHDGGGIDKYEWDLDGVAGFEDDAGTNPFIERRLQRIGFATETRRIGLQVTDGDGLTDTAFERVTIIGTGPVARFTVTPNPVQVNQAAVFDASTSTGAADYSWDLDGNGTFEVGPTLEKALNHRYAESGTVTVRLRVRDAAGLPADAEEQVMVTDASARAVAARRTRTFSASLTRVRLPDGLGRARHRGAITTVRGVVVRGRLVAKRRGLGPLRQFRRARWLARLTLVSRPARARLTGVALARFPRGAGRACLRIRMHTRRRGAPTGTIKVLGGRGPAAQLRGGGRFRFSDLRPTGRLQARLGAARPLPKACTRLRR